MGMVALAALARTSPSPCPLSRDGESLAALVILVRERAGVLLSYVVMGGWPIAGVVPPVTFLPRCAPWATGIVRGPAVHHESYVAVARGA